MWTVPSCFSTTEPPYRFTLELEYTHSRRDYAWIGAALVQPSELCFPAWSVLVRVLGNAVMLVHG